MLRRILIPALAVAALVFTPAAAPSGARAVPVLDPGGGGGGTDQGGPSIDSGGACSSTHTFSSGSTLFETCFTSDGNMVEFKVGVVGGGPFELIRSGAFVEGYALCSTAGGVSGFDASVLGETGFNDPTIAQPGGANTFPLTITRTTTDGRFSLKQKFSASASRIVTITMSVTNTSGGDLAGVKLSRLGDIDLIGEVFDIHNDFGLSTRRSAIVFDNPGSALTLTGTSRGRPVVTSVGFFPDNHDSCAPLAGVSVTGPEDMMAKATYNLGTINAGDTREVAFTYSGD
ncbi:hypothetical protein F0U44_10950 [Nocardioides humilatus]|uniref:Secreted protein n=1 Tax=Nocardioides humilatus TaxID=2607660 RepID=A0A5B1LEU2_9ACTN|nr:hypothetical protein [Nocardioides humilatus]KAA1418976.1 hypothetical protein F0U44_10950 [Nocardioides humilatus]